jgi:hypothetical protein
MIEVLQQHSDNLLEVNVLQEKDMVLQKLETHLIPQERSLVIVFLLALGYGRKRRSRKKREKVNFAEDTVTDTG